MSVDVVSQQFLKEYIQYARYTIDPVISEEAVEALVQVCIVRFLQPTVSDISFNFRAICL